LVRFIHWLPSVRLLVWLLAVGPPLLVGLSLLWLSERSSERIATDLSNRLVVEAQSRVRDEIADYLRPAVAASDLTARRIDAGELDPAELDSWLAPCLAELEAFPDIASITFGAPDGRTFWVIRTPGGYGCAFKLDSDATTIQEYSIEPGTTSPGSLVRSYEFDPRRRPWYTAALDAGEPVWSEVYTWVGADFGAYTIGAAYVRPIHDEAGEFQGVLSIDVTLGALSDFLSTVPLAATGLVLIVDDQDRLVASSRGGVVVQGDERETLAGALRRAQASVDFRGEGRARGRLGDAWARYGMVRLGAAGSLGLRMIAAIPEAEILTGVREARARMLVVGAVVIAVVVILSALVTNGLSGRLRALREHVRAVSTGDFDSKLDDAGPAEWRSLARDLNRMASDLESYIETRKGLEIAMEVQQALLPEGEPEIPGLEIAGHSKYCDATGGDYYDFLELTRVGEHAELIAVGDVMGHGVAAALLMATARAALRSHATEVGSLGALMTRVNDLLAADARHGRFMTLSLLVIDPEARSVRWASAGHDPALVVDPETGDSQELDEGDVPLGIMPGVRYEEYRTDELPEGAVILVGTDGVWEMADASGEQYGKERLLAEVKRVRDRRPREIAQAIERDLESFRAEAPVKDDVTFVVIKLD